MSQLAPEPVRLSVLITYTVIYSSIFITFAIFNITCRHLAKDLVFENRVFAISKTAGPSERRYVFT